MNLDEKIKNSVTSIYKAVFPNTTNHYDTLFGGSAMALMVETAFITATRFARKKLVTVSSDKIEFLKPIPSGTIVELIGTVVSVGKKSMLVSVEVFIEEMFFLQREKAIRGNFTLVAINEQEQPINII